MFRSLLFVLLLSGCAQTFWAFPPGRTQNDFRRDEAACHQSLAFEACLTERGYRQITQSEFVSINQTPVTGDIIAHNMKTGEMFHGTTTSIPGTQKGTVIIQPFGNSAKKCQGQAWITVSAAGGTGSLGKGRLICNDGNILNIEFTYESSTAGFGVGTDTSGHVYRFIFGYGTSDLKTAKDMFIEKFKEIEQKKIKKKKLKTGRGA